MMVPKEIGWSSEKTATGPPRALGDHLRNGEFCAYCWGQNKIWSPAFGTFLVCEYCHDEDGQRIRG